MTPVERAVQAMIAANEEHVGLPFSQLIEKMARAAISALMEPSEAMLKAAATVDFEYHDDDVDSTRFWKSMIRAALEEK